MFRCKHFAPGGAGDIIRFDHFYIHFAPDGAWERGYSKPIFSPAKDKINTNLTAEKPGNLRVKRNHFTARPPPALFTTTRTFKCTHP